MEHILGSGEAENRLLKKWTVFPPDLSQLWKGTRLCPIFAQLAPLEPGVQAGYTARCLEHISILNSQGICHNKSYTCKLTGDSEFSLHKDC